MVAQSTDQALIRGRLRNLATGRPACQRSEPRHFYLAKSGHYNLASTAHASESVQRFLRDALRVIRAATDISGDVCQALFWYRNEPLPVFDYKTAEQLVSDGRTDDLLRYVSSFEAGAAG